MSQRTIDSEIAEAKSACQSALDMAKSLGATHAEVSISRQRGLTVGTRLGETETVEFNQDGAMGITVYRGKCKGSASTADLSEAALKKTIESANDIARFTSEDSCSGLADAELLELNPTDLDLYHPTDVSPDSAIALCKSAEDAAFQVDERIKNSDGASLGAYDGFRVYGNTHEQMVGYPSTRFSLSCSVIAESDNEMERNYAFTVSRQLSGLDNAEKVGKDAAFETVSRLGSQKLKTMKVPVIFRADIASSLFGHLVSAVSGGSIYRKSSFLLDAMGKPIFSDNVTISEDPFIKQGLASSAFDREGVKTTARNIIDAGVLETFLLTSYSARKLGMQTTGHAGGIHNWFVKPTLSGELDALLKKMGTGLLVTELMGQGVNIVTGDYSRGAAGFWVENGEIKYPVSEITIAGNLATMFKQVVDISDDIERRGGVFTGSILLEEIQVAGN